MSAASPRHGRSDGPLTLLAIGSAAGIYSGLFGVGGGAVMVPLLILWRGMHPRVAAATSVAAIVVIATAGALTHAAYGNVRLGAAAYVAVPAVVGALLGTALQQRVRKEWISYGLAALMVVVGLDLLRGAW